MSLVKIINNVTLNFANPISNKGQALKNLNGMKLQKLGVDKDEGDEIVTKDSPMHTSTFVEKENNLHKAKTTTRGQKDDTPQVWNLTSNNPSMSFKGLKGIQQNEEEVMKHLQLK